METHEDRVKREQINKENSSNFILNNKRLKKLRKEIIEKSYYDSKSSKKDMVNHPNHYCQHPSGIECIEIIRHYCFDIGSAIKYLWRAGLKVEEGMTDKAKEIEDLKKSIWYINDRIKMLENGNKS